MECGMEPGTQDAVDSGGEGISVAGAGRACRRGGDGPTAAMGGAPRTGRRRSPPPPQQRQTTAAITPTQRPHSPRTRPLARRGPPPLRFNSAHGRRSPSGTRQSQSKERRSALPSPPSAVTECGNGLPRCHLPPVPPTSSPRKHTSCLLVSPPQTTIQHAIAFRQIRAHPSPSAPSTHPSIHPSVHPSIHHLLMYAL